MQIVSLLHVAFYEYWPFTYREEAGNVVEFIGFNFLYMYKEGYYTFIEDFDIYLYNIIGWLLVCGFIILVG